jgi:uncharacterized protein YidB (DUF937 family)
MASDGAHGGRLGSLFGGRGGRLGTVLQDLLGGKAPDVVADAAPATGRDQRKSDDRGTRPAGKPSRTADGAETDSGGDRVPAGVGVTADRATRSGRPGTGPAGPGRLMPPNTRPGGGPQTGIQAGGVQRSPLAGAPRRQSGPPSAVTRRRTEATGPSAVGLESLLERMRRAGLTDQVDSWLSDGPNRTIDPQQVFRAVGPQQLSDLARTAGVSQEEMATGLAAALPAVVSEMTPHGRMPTASQVQHTINRMVG